MVQELGVAITLLAQVQLHEAGAEAVHPPQQVQQTPVSNDACSPQSPWSKLRLHTAVPTSKRLASSCRCVCAMAQSISRSRLMQAARVHTCLDHVLHSRIAAAHMECLTAQGPAYLPSMP